MNVADRLHQRAMGFEYYEAQAHKLKKVEYKDGKRLKETERLETIMVKRVVSPDTTACIFWLKNRRKVEWRERQEAPRRERMTPARSSPWRSAISHRRGEGLSPP